MIKKERPVIIVRGAGDLATGVIIRLHKCGFKLMVCECEDPSAIRRKAALCQAVWNGETTVEGVTAKTVKDREEAFSLIEKGVIPLFIDPECAIAKDIKPIAIVDAILAKKNLGTDRSMAQITVGLGPGFTAGKDVDAVIETMRGHHLGKVIYEGSPIANTGIPGNIGGFTKERVIHSHIGGKISFVTDEKGETVDIGSIVKKGQTIAKIGTSPVKATIDGVLRGLIHEGYTVPQHFKIADIDPRLEQVAYCDTVSDKARAIAGGVLEALLTLSEERNLPLL